MCLQLSPSTQGVLKASGDVVWLRHVSRLIFQASRCRALSLDLITVVILLGWHQKPSSFMKLLLGSAEICEGGPNPAKSWMHWSHCSHAEVNRTWVFWHLIGARSAVREVQMILDLIFTQNSASADIWRAQNKSHEDKVGRQISNKI